jgi:hypothetical protein
MSVLGPPMLTIPMRATLGAGWVRADIGQAKAATPIELITSRRFIILQL